MAVTLFIYGIILSIDAFISARITFRKSPKLYSVKFDWNFFRNRLIERIEQLGEEEFERMEIIVKYSSLISLITEEATPDRKQAKEIHHSLQSSHFQNQFKNHKLCSDSSNQYTMKIILSQLESLFRNYALPGFLYQYRCF